MGLISSILGSKKNQESSSFENININENIDFEDKINTIILIMKNLGFLNANEIEKSLEEEKSSYDKELFEKIKVLIPSSPNYQKLAQYVKATDLGYGELKQAEIIYSLKKIIDKEADKGKKSLEILEELIFASKLDISRYKSILIDFEETINKVNSNIMLTESEKLSKIDYWISFYKVEKLGYPTDATNKINNLIKSLKELEYGGYGPKEITKFRNNCQKEIDQGKLNSRNINQVIKDIESKIYEPLKSKYLNDLTVLKRRISLVENSKEISPFEKQLQQEEFIVDFNERNGHEIDISNQLLIMKKNLAHLKYSGYSKSAIDVFENSVQNIIINGKQNKLSDKTILATIKIEYNKYINNYNYKVKELEDKLNDPSISISKQQELVEEFKKDMTTKVDFNEIIKEISNKARETKQAENIAEFVEKCREVISNNQKANIPQFETLKEIEKLKLGILNQDKIEKEIENYSKELKELGYGPKAITNYIDDCRNSKTFNNEENQKLIIKNKYEILKNNYFYNKKVFTLWKESELKKNPEESNKESLEQIEKHLLSLSPRDLQLYYEEDKKKKKDLMEKHNFELKFKYLATKESQKKFDPTIINKRLEDLKIGINPYTQEELNQAEESLTIKALLDVDNILRKDEKLITIEEYIDSTLYKQIMTIEAENFSYLNNKE